MPFIFIFRETVRVLVSLAIPSTLAEGLRIKERIEYIHLWRIIQRSEG